MDRVNLPDSYDYVGVYVTNRCHLRCDYCITSQRGSGFSHRETELLTAKQWIEGLNRLVLPPDMPITLQGGEPFLYDGIWEVLEGVTHKMDILTALPPFLNAEHFRRLKTLEWNRRTAPYPTIRVSWHKGQHDCAELVERIAEMQSVVSIGLYCLEHPALTEEELLSVEELGRRFGVEVRRKEFLGDYRGSSYGSLKYRDACGGVRRGVSVQCRNTVVPIAPNGDIFRCHSDLYFGRVALKIGNLLDEGLRIEEGYRWCENYGTCSECDVKIKTNRYQVHGYTSVDIRFAEGGGETGHE